ARGMIPTRVYTRHICAHPGQPLAVLLCGSASATHGRLGGVALSVQLADYLLEYLAALFKVAEHVKARARRRQQHIAARARHVARGQYRLLEVAFALVVGKARAVERRYYVALRFAYHDCAHYVRPLDHQLGHGRVVRLLVRTAQYYYRRTVHGLYRLER